MQECFHDHLHQPGLDPHAAAAVTAGLERLATAVANLSEIGKVTSREQLFLESLFFSRMVSRHNVIEKSHEDTFTWIFKKSLESDSMPVIFVEWLRNEHGVYWIEGKAGSGKSTLMKFLCRSRATTEHLGVWAGGKRLVVAGFFFWNAGTRLQKSREGLFRSLLFEILRKCPDLLPGVMGAVDMPELCGEETSWDEDDLLRMYQHVVSQGTSTRFCFFIDGLDEYEDGKRGHEDLLEAIRKMHLSPDVKLCVSSRPWVIFRDEFGNTAQWHIRLEDLTRDDIRSFVSFKLNKNAQFRRLMVWDSKYPMPVERVLEKAQGVFLWVRLVVRSLIEGLTYHDSVATLSERLERFPDDLDDFFQQMIDSIPPIYRTKTARTFKVALEAPRPLQVMTYSFIEDAEENPECCLSVPTEPMPDEEIDRRVEQMVRQIDGRCKGLLEVVEDDENRFGRHKIDFLHRTVRDFLHQSTKTKRLFQDVSESDDKTAWLLGQAILSVLKRKHYTAQVRSGVWEGAEDTIDELITQIRKIGTDAASLRKARPLLESANQVCHDIFDPSGSAAFSVDFEFLALAAKRGLAWYVKMEAERRNDLFRFDRSRKGRNPVLLARVLCSNNLGLWEPSASVVQILLENGGDPRFTFASGSIWQSFLERLPAIGEDFAPAEDEILKILSLLVSHNANLSAKLEAARIIGSGSRNHLDTAADMISAYFPRADIQALRSLEKQAKSRRRMDRLSLGLVRKLGSKSPAGI